MPARNRGRLHALICAATLLVAAWIGACSDHPTIVSPPPPPPLDGAIVSNPLQMQSLAARSMSPGVSGGAAETDLVFVSLAPGTVAEGSLAVVRNVDSTGTVSTTVSGGGFDPVPIPASGGDSVEIAVVVPSGPPILLGGVVPARRRPVVVRTNPPPRKRDVPLNSRVVLVFSEPIDPGTLSSSVRLFRGTTAIAGAVSLLQGSATAAVFVSDAQLDANTDYQLVVTQAVRDLDGDALAADVTVDFTTGSEVVGSAWSVTVIPDSAFVLAGSQVQMTAVPLDTNGAPILGLPVTWSGDAPAVATVSATGVVTALTAGAVHVQAQVDNATGIGTVLVVSTITPVDSVEVAPGSATIPINGMAELTAVLRDSAGNVLSLRPVTWATDNPSIATVTIGSRSTARVRGVSLGSTRITATSEGRSAAATITVVDAGHYRTIDAGDGHTCAVTDSLFAFCWGANNEGQLGIAFVSGGATPVPSGVAGGHQFVQIAAYMGRTCAVTAADVAYCWGFNHDGVLGGPASGSAPEPLPQLVPGGLRFRSIGVGQHYMCGLTAGGAAYCWGWNQSGELGSGRPQDCSLPCTIVPIAVSGGLTFTELSVGDSHACALAVSGAAYCWGLNFTGQVGDGTTVDRTVPVPVAGGLQFTTISAGYYHTCGLASDSLAYCWGLNGDGQLGRGTTTGPESCASPNWGAISCSRTPVPVVGSIKWTTISASGQLGHVCALTVNGVAYCWGVNSSDQLGTGTITGPNDCRLSNQTCSPTPLPVAGGHTFGRVSAGSSQTCAITRAGIAYCWGANYSGQLGTGNTANSNVPVKVAGQP